MRKLPWMLVPLFLLACGEEPATPTLEQGPSFNFMNNPDNGNPRIARYGDVFGLLIVDETHGLFSLQAAWDRQFGCVGTPEIYTLMDVQDILENPDDPAAGRIVDLVQAQGIYIAVYQDYDAWAASDFDCADLFARKLGEGTGKVIYTDNDLLVYLRPNSNANAYGFTAQGAVSLVGGGTAKYKGVLRCVWDGEDGSRINRCKARIDLR